jgi:hypothetical protein
MRRFEPSVHEGMSPREWLVTLADEFIKWANEEARPEETPPYHHLGIEADGFITIHPKI